jgi:hypothetical protein
MLENELQFTRYFCIVGTPSTLLPSRDFVNCAIYLRISLLKQICLQVAM